MTSKEFVIWLKGFTVACHEYAPTPKQWDILRETLMGVDDVNVFNDMIGYIGNTKTEINHPQHSDTESTEIVKSKKEDRFPF